MKKIILTILIFISIVEATSIKTQQRHYDEGHYIRVDVTDMAGGSQDWIGIYPAGASNDWENVVDWKWTGGITDGKIFFSGIDDAGLYDVRAFFNNSFDTEASYTFTVDALNLETTVTTNKSLYDAGESITVTLSNMLGDSQDWVGIYPAGSSNDWENVIAWSWSGGIVNGDVSFEGLSAGEYDVRVFFNNSFAMEASDTFTVQAVNLPPTVYESAENGISGDWDTVSGPYAPLLVSDGFNSSYAIKLTTDWVSNTHNDAEYHLDLHHNVSQKFLEVDVGGVGVSGGRPGGKHSNSPAGYMPHYIIGVQVSTLDGERTMYWDSWYTHEGFTAHRTDYGNGYISLVYPSPKELVRGYGYADINLWERHRFDLDAWLQILEPDNHITSVNTFIATGGFLDNITLKSN